MLKIKKCLAMMKSFRDPRVCSNILIISLLLIVLVFLDFLNNSPSQNQGFYFLFHSQGHTRSGRHHIPGVVLKWLEIHNDVGEKKLIHLGKAAVPLWRLDHIPCPQ